MDNQNQPQAVIDSQAMTDPRHAQIEQLARFLDSSIKLPFINYRIGWEPIIGLIPGIGDVAGVLLSGIIIVQAARLGTPKTVLLYMLFNAAIEALVGLVPIVGDLFDFVWKSNSRNVRLMQRALNDPKGAKSRSRTMMATFSSGFFLVLLLLVLTIGILGWLTFDWIYQFVGNIGF